MKILARILRWSALASLLLIVLVGACVGFVVWRTWPGGDLAIEVAGLSAPVNVSIDQDGIPRIHAATELDAAAAMGFLHARERMFQMDLMRRAARGELSAVFGAATLPLDRFNRLLDLRDHAAADVAGLPADARAMLESYARGVNAWIASNGRFSALEFAALGAPRPWTAADCLLWGKTMGLYLSGNWRTELARLQLAGHLTPGQINALWPSQSAALPQASLMPALAHMASELATLVPRFPQPFTLPASASNEWAVDGAHSATGAPLLAGDPHLAFGLPPIWYLARIETPGQVLVGATAPGVPFMVIGRNAKIAWTFTTTGADVQDLFIETPSHGGYLTEAGDRAFITRTETIAVLGQSDQVLQVRETRHGPLISDLTGTDGPMVALSMANLVPGDGAAAGLLALNRAASVAEAGATAPQITSPVQNLLVADAHGIGFFVTGRVPIRRSGDGAFPARGDDGSQDWIGWASGGDLPHAINPPSGRLVNANERVAGPDFPVFLGRDWFDDTRAQRIRQMLDATPKQDIAGFTHMQVDDLDLNAVAVLPRLLPLEARLSGWDGRMLVDTAQPLIFNAWMIEFAQGLLDRLGVPGSALAAAAPWPDLARSALGDGAGMLCGDACDTLLRDSHDRAFAALARRFGNDPSQWHWGDAHQAVFANPAMRSIPGLGALSEARIAEPGDDSTVGRGGLRQDNFEAVHGGAYRGVYDLADLERSRFMLAPGQSGDPASPLSRNFVRKWRDGDTIAIPAAPDHVAVRITLSP